MADGTMGATSAATAAPAGESSSSSGAAGSSAPPSDREASTIIAGLDDAQLTEHLKKDKRGDFQRPSPAPDKKPDTSNDEKPPTDSEAAKLKKIIADKDAMIGRQTNDVGSLRAELAAMRQQLDAMTKKPQVEPAKINADDFFSDPEGAVTRIVGNLTEKQKAEQREQTEKASTARNQTFKTVSEKVPNIAELLPDMISIAQEDGLPDGDIDQFSRDPFGEHPQALIALARRAIQQRKIAELQTPAKANAQAPAPIRPPSPAVTAGMGRGGDNESSMISPDQLSGMSMDELNALLKKQKPGG